MHRTQKSAMYSFCWSLLAVSLLATQARAEDVIIGLITRTNTNPFYLAMKQGAQQKAKDLGVRLDAYAGKFDGDVEGQVVAIEQLIAVGAKGILLSPSDGTEIVPTVKKARAAGIVVISLETPLDPSTAADATIATDNFNAGKLLGLWAKARLGPKADSVKVARLDFGRDEPAFADIRRDGFLVGIGIVNAVPTVGCGCECSHDACRRSCKECDGARNKTQIVGNDVTGGSTEGGRIAMEKLLQSTPEIDVIYADNASAAAGGYAALKAGGKERDVLFLTVDGSCSAVEDIRRGAVSALSQEYPFLMGSRGVEAVVDFVRRGKKLEPTPGLDFVAINPMLVTNSPQSNVESVDATAGAKICLRGP
jgi:fructose transport system substrate-binding protein